MPGRFRWQREVLFGALKWRQIMSKGVIQVKTNAFGKVMRPAPLGVAIFINPSAEFSKSGWQCGG